MSDSGDFFTVREGAARFWVNLEDYLPVGEMSLSEELRRACDELVPPGGMVANFHNSAGWGFGSRTLGVADRG